MSALGLFVFLKIRTSPKHPSVYHMRRHCDWVRLHCCLPVYHRKRQAAVICQWARCMNFTWEPLSRVCSYDANLCEFFSRSRRHLKSRFADWGSRVVLKSELTSSECLPPLAALTCLKGFLPTVTMENEHPGYPKRLCRLNMPHLQACLHRNSGLR